jgi:hypothetical protein
MNGKKKLPQLLMAYVKSSLLRSFSMNYTQNQFTIYNFVCDSLSLYVK